MARPPFAKKGYPVMLRPRPPRRSRVVLALVVLGALLGATAPAALADGGPVANPYSPAYGHPYRHGVVPTIARQQQMDQWARSAGHFGPPPKPLSYGGAIDGIGVTTGAEKVYLVFWGSQWGTAGTDASGYTTLTGDPSGEAPYLQRLIAGLGTNGEQWSGVMTQYCEGVATGAQSCPSSNASHVAYPTGGALAGVWVDGSVASPSQATAAQLGTEAVNAAAQFGNTTASANRDAQYVILSPTGTHPDGFNTASGQFCAWHDWNGDSYVGVTSPSGDIAFTNMPYVTDMGTSCGQNFVNSGSAGTLDGVSIVEGHEYAETITDQNPAGGWTDSSGSENGDKCAWILPGTSGGAFNLDLGASGSFAMQTTWANDANGCEASHPIVANGSANTVTVSNPGSQTGTVGSPASLQIAAADSGTQTLTYGASGLPAGLSIGSGTGQITGTPTTAATYAVTVTATDGTGASGSASFSWTINPSTTNTITVTTTSLPTAHTGRSYSVTLTASGGTGVYTWTLTGSLPSGLGWFTDGTISGTPATGSSGKYTFTVTVTDGTESASQSLTLNVVGH
jgi:Putative Ig domain